MTARIACGAMVERSAKGTRQINRSSHPIRKLVAVASRLWQLRDSPRRALGQRRDPPDNEEWSGRWESKISQGHGKALIIMALQANKIAAYDFCVKNRALPANASESQPMWHWPPACRRERRDPESRAFVRLARRDRDCIAGRNAFFTTPSMRRWISSPLSRRVGLVVY
jgi:hypothetical protein